MVNVKDPYQALGLDHTASAVEIKKQYRLLARKYHPDRLSDASEQEQNNATTKFASISSAYALLSDARRKEQYDHIYKYGGFDEIESNDSKTPAQPGAASPPMNRKTVGYTCTNPFAFAFTNGRVRSTTTMAGVSIPSRLEFARSGLSFAFSSGEYRQVGGQRQFTSKTTKFVQGRKVTKTEVTTIHTDGRKEVITNEDGHIKRHVTPSCRPTNISQSEDSQKTLWQGFRERLLMCTNPCAVVAAH